MPDMQDVQRTDAEHVPMRSQGTPRVCRGCGNTTLPSQGCGNDQSIAPQLRRLSQTCANQVMEQPPELSSINILHPWLL